MSPSGTFAAARNRDLRWRISEGNDLMLHPVHIHGCQFRIISRDGKPPEAERAGWKDVAPIHLGVCFREHGNDLVQIVRHTLQCL